MRVLITRPRDQAGQFAEALRAIGAEVVFLPMIQIEPVSDPATLERALSRLHCYDWLVLTSVNAVELVLERMAAIGMHNPPENLRVAAVGPKTASKLEEQGISVDFVPQEYTGEAIVPGLGDLRGCWVLLPTTDIAPNTIPQAVEASGGIAHVITVYHTRPAVLDPNGLAALQEGIDVLTFTSGSAVRNFRSLVLNTGLDPFELPGDPQIACIGPKTARSAREAGFQVDIVADVYTTEGLIESVKRVITKTR